MISRYKATNTTSVLAAYLSRCIQLFSFTSSQWKGRLKYSLVSDSASANAIIIYFCLANSFCSEQADKIEEKGRNAHISQHFTQTSQIVHRLTLLLSGRTYKVLLFHLWF